MPASGHVIALAPDRAELDPIRRGLASAGVHAQVRDAQPGTYVVEDTSLHDDVHGMRTGILLGLLVGALVGLLLVLVVPGLRELSRTGQAILVGGVALQGTMPAIMWALGRTDPDDDPERTWQVGAGDQLVVVDREPQAGRARLVLEHHHAVFLDEDHPTRRVR